MGLVDAVEDGGKMENVVGDGVVAQLQVCLGENHQQNYSCC
jgi:hypothetical protein